MCYQLARRRHGRVECDNQSTQCLCLGSEPLWREREIPDVAPNLDARVARLLIGGEEILRNRAVLQQLRDALLLRHELFVDGLQEGVGKPRAQQCPLRAHATAGVKESSLSILPETNIGKQEIFSGMENMLGIPETNPGNLD